MVGMSTRGEDMCVWQRGVVYVAKMGMRGEVRCALRSARVLDSWYSCVLGLLYTCFIPFRQTRGVQMRSAKTQNG